MDRFLRFTSRGLMALGLAVALAGLVPESWLRGLARQAGHEDDLTPARVARYRVACWISGAVLIAIGTAGTSRYRFQIADFLHSLRAEFRTDRASRLAWQTRTRIREVGVAHLLVLILVLATGVILRARLMTRAMLYDEAYSFLNYARRPLYEALLDYNNTNNHLLNTALMHLAYQVAGQVDWVLRLPAFVAGILMMPAVYFLARRVWGAGAALISTALIAASPMLINYSAEARGYTLVTLCGLWMAHHLMGALATGRRTDWLLAMLAAVAGFYAMPIMVYPFAGCLVWGFAAAATTRLPEPVAGTATPQTRRPGSDRKMAPTSIVIWATSVLTLTGLAYLPTWIYSDLVAYDSSFVQPVAWSRWVRFFPRAWAEGVIHYSQVPLWGDALWPALIVIALAMIGLVKTLTRSRPSDRSSPSSPSQGRWLLFAVPAAAAAVMAIGRVAPPPRVFVFLAPWWLMMAAVGSVTILRWLIGHLSGKKHRRDTMSGTEGSGLKTEWVAAGLAVFVIAVAAGFSASREVLYYPEQKRLSPEVIGVTRYLHKQIQPGDRVLVTWPIDKSLEYYLVQSGVAVPEAAQLNGQPQPGETLWLVKPRELSRDEALGRIPGSRLDQFEDLKALERLPWHPQWAGKDLELWQTRVPAL